MEWSLRDIGTYKITSDKSYIISFCVVEQKTKFAAWPPNDEGKLAIQSGNVSFLQALGYFDKMDEAKYCCEAHYAEANNLEPPTPYIAPDPIPDIAEESQPEILNNPTSTSGDFTPGAPPGYETEKPKKNQGQCKTVSDLVKYCGMNEGQAAHILEARAEKIKLQERALRASRYLFSKDFTDYNYDEITIVHIKPKKLKEIIAKANEVRVDNNNE